MKERSRIITIALVALLAATVLLWVLLRAFGPGEDPKNPSGTRPTHPVGSNTTGTQSHLPGQVRLYTCDPVLHRIYTDFAESYGLQSDNQVVVLPLAQGNCGEALAQALESDAPPTLFCIHDQQTLEALDPRLMDLSGQPILETLSNPAFALAQGERTVALAVDVQAYGLICNNQLLAGAGFSRNDFKTFADLENAVKHISANYSTKPFGTLQFSDTDHNGTACVLSLTFPVPQQMRSFLDLYRDHCLTGGDAGAQFLAGKTIFYLGSTEDYQWVSQMADGAHNLDILPMLYAGGKQMQYVSSHFWALDARANPQDQAATLDFLLWMVTAGQDGTAPIDRLQLLSPFRDAAYYSNIFERKLRGYMANEASAVSFPRCHETDLALLEQLSAALQAYTADPSDQTWAAVEALLQ